MVNILFVCHGNICRSTMAEYVMKDMVKKRGIADKFYINSAATSTDEIGNGVHHGTVNKLREVGIPVGNHRAVQITKTDYEKYDYIIGMDGENRHNMLRAFGGDKDGKVSLMLDFTDSPRDVADPWFTHDFDATYEDVSKGCEALLEHIEKMNFMQK